MFRLSITIFPQIWTCSQIKTWSGIIYNYQHLTVLDYQAYLRIYSTYLRSFNLKQTIKQSTQHLKQMEFSLLFSPVSPWLCQLGHQNKLPETKRKRDGECFCLSLIAKQVHRLTPLKNCLRTNNRHGHTYTERLPHLFLTKRCFAVDLLWIISFVLCLV